MENTLIIIFIAITFGALFFIADFFEHKHPKVHISFIAGTSVTYFFLLVLPEISEGMPEYPLHLEILEYLFILIGFALVHVSEKLVLQKVEGRSQKRMRKLLKKENIERNVEREIQNLIDNEIMNETLDMSTLKHLGQTLSSLKEQENQIKVEIQRYKVKIQDHINKDLGKLRFYTNYAYHALVGYIGVSLLFIDFIPGILFCIFAWARTIISNRSETHVIFTDLDIYEKLEEDQNIYFKIFLSSAAFTGIIVGLISELIFPTIIDLEIIFILFSFISGVTLYTIVTHSLPEKEHGSPLYFVMGVVGLALLILFLNMFAQLIN